jgi:hypothetical protein
MTQDRPTAAELTAAVREFLERDVMPATEGRVNFHTRVSINALRMIERELLAAPALDAAERARAAAILGHDGTARELEREIASGIRTGAIPDDDEVVRSHVRATVREKLLVANPGYLEPKNP